MVADQPAESIPAFLDDPAVYDRIDPAKMRSFIDGLPRQFSESIVNIERVSWPSLDPRSISAIAVLGMGGSAIGGELVRGCIASTCEIPFFVVRDYTLPNHLDNRSLIFASSYSGNTEETLSAVREAQQRSCSVVALTAGGRLGDLAQQHSWPWIKLPSGFAPRAALGYSFSSIMLSLEAMKVIVDVQSQLATVAQFLAHYGQSLQPNSPFERNPAKQLAHRLQNRTPLIYGGTGVMATVATRWRGQLCENAKQYAIAGECPECNHNEIVGWESLIRNRSAYSVILLRDEDDHVRVGKRFDILAEILKEKKIESIAVESSGNSPLERVFSLVVLGDWISYYLAIINQVDPMRIEAIDMLKTRMGPWNAGK